MQAFQERVLLERNALSLNVDLLAKFLTGETFASLDRDEQLRLLQQDAYMKLYLNILNQRIDAFK